MDPEAHHVPMTATTLTIRPATATDADELDDLARLDSARPLAGDVLLAEASGRPVAAMALDSGRAVADPFLPSAAAVAVLRVRAEQLRVGRRAESLLTARRLLLRTASG